MDFSNHRDGCMVFIRFSFFLLYSVRTVTALETKRLREFEEI